MAATATSAPRRVLLASPRGYCAGVDRAVQTVEEALELYGPPVYVRKEIVHNKHVVAELAARGAIFVEEETEVPEGELVVFSAHGVAPSVHENARTRGLRTIDATCPLVTKVHVEARKFAEEGYTIVLIGHEGHEEVEGTTGEAPGSIVLVQTTDDADRLEVEPPGRGGARARRPLAPDRQRRPGSRRMDRRRRDRRDHLRRQRPRGARRRARRLLPRAWGGGRLGAADGGRGRSLHAAEEDPPRARRPSGRLRATAVGAAAAGVLATFAAPVSAGPATVIRTGGPSAPGQSKVAIVASN